jgi:hypothetical protein
MNILRSIAAVLLGYLIILFGGVLFLQLFGRHPMSLGDSPLAMLGDVLYILTFGILGGYVAAWLGRPRPVAHALAVVVVYWLMAGAMFEISEATNSSAIVAMLAAVPFALLGGLRVQQGGAVV